MRKKGLIVTTIILFVVVTSSILYFNKNNIEKFFKKENLKITGSESNPSTKPSQESDRKKRIINEIKEKYIEQGYLDTEQVEKFNILKIQEYGFYKSKPDVHYYIVNMDLMCTDGTLDCFKRKIESYPDENEKYGYNAVIWVVLDNDEFIEFRDGMSVWMHSDFIQTSGSIE